MIYSIWGPKIEESSCDSNFQTLRHEPLFSVFSTFEQLCLRSVCSHFELKWAAYLCQKGNRGTLFKALFRWGGHYHNISPVFSVLKRKLQTITTFPLEISMLSTFLSPTANGESDLIQRILKYSSSFVYILCLSLLQVASHFCMWNEFLELEMELIPMLLTLTSPTVFTRNGWFGLFFLWEPD